MLHRLAEYGVTQWQRWFPERQIYLRSQGQVRYLTLKPAVQCSLAVGVFAALCWSTVASVHLVLRDEILTARDQQITDIRKAYTGLTVDFAHIQQRFLTRTLELEAKHRQLEQLIARKQALSEDIDLPQQQAATDATAQPLPTVAMVEPAPLQSANPAGTVSAESFSRTVQALEVRLSELNGSQYNLIDAFSRDADTVIGTLEELIGQTGLDVDRVLAQLGDTSTPAGGPLITSVKTIGDQSGLSHLSARVGRLALLREALYSLPLIEPVENYYVSSNYGNRRDPLTRRRAFHSGLDMVAPLNDPVLASAPGTIISAGRNGPYGKMVEIDHGHGIKSRYGHLRTIEVEKGDNVAVRQQIGRVGSTGRSTGPHLHFEVWFDGKTRNPRKFLKAGENVFQR